MIYNDKGKAEILRKTYLKNFSVPVQDDQVLDYVSPIPEEEHLTDIIISEDEIMKAIKKINTFTSIGPDHIPALVLKKCKNMVTILKMILRNSLDNNEIPEVLKRSVINPLLKPNQTIVYYIHSYEMQ